MVGKLNKSLCDGNPAISFSQDHFDLRRDGRVIAMLDWVRFDSLKRLFGVGNNLRGDEAPEILHPVGLVLDRGIDLVNPVSVLAVPIEEWHGIGTEVILGSFKVAGACRHPWRVCRSVVSCDPEEDHPVDHSIPDQDRGSVPVLLKSLGEIECEASIQRHSMSLGFLADGIPTEAVCLSYQRRAKIRRATGGAQITKISYQGRKLVKWLNHDESAYFQVSTPERIAALS